MSKEEITPEEMLMWLEKMEAMAITIKSDEILSVLTSLKDRVATIEYEKHLNSAKKAVDND